MLVNGEEAQVTVAIQQLVESMASGLGAPEDEFEARIVVSNTLAGMIIGKSGEQIKNIQSMSNTNMKINKLNDNGGSNERIVTIKGTSDNVQMAILEVMHLQKDEEKASDFFFIDYSEKGGGKPSGKGD